MRRKITKNTKRLASVLSIIAALLISGSTFAQTACTEDANLVASGSIEDNDGTPEGGNPIAHLIDDDLGTRVSIPGGYPRVIVIDLEATYSIDQINVYAFRNRAYQYTISGSTTYTDINTTTGFTTLVDRSANTSQGTVYNAAAVDGGNVLTDTFTATDVRYLRLEVTDISPSGDSSFVSFWEIEALCAGTPLSFDSVDAADGVSVFPNPFEGFVNVSSEDAIDEVTIYSSLGSVVKTVEVGASEVQIDTQDIASGVYIMKISTDNGVYTKKLIK